MEKQILKISEIQSNDLLNYEGIPTRIKELDRILGGIKESTLTILTGEIGKGKLTFALQIIANALEQNKNVVIHSGKVNNSYIQYLIDLHLAGENNVEKVANKNSKEIYQISNETREKIHNWYKEKLFSCKCNTTIIGNDEIKDLLFAIEKCIIQYDVKLICIDNLSNIIPNFNTLKELHNNRVDFIYALKRIANEFKVSIILITPSYLLGGNSLNEMYEDMYSIADNIIQYNGDLSLHRNSGEISLIKNRRLIECLTNKDKIKVFFNKKTRRITDTENENYSYGWEK